MYTEDVVTAMVRQKYAALKSLRAVADTYPSTIKHSDIQRILQDPPRFPTSRIKRAALEVYMPATVVVIGDGLIPDGAQAIHARMCPCGQAFIPNNPNRTHCFICSPYRKAGQK